MTSTTISDGDFQKYREFFYRKTGIQLEPSKRYFVDKRLVERIIANGNGNFRAKFLTRYFKRLDDDLRQAVEFTPVNLSERADTRAYRNFDVIFCRNLSIYFDDVSHKSAAETFFDAIKPCGFISLGHTESMSRISSLYKVRKFPKAMMFQKALENK